MIIQRVKEKLKPVQEMFKVLPRERFIQIVNYAPKSRIDQYYHPMILMMANWEINTPLRVSHFLSQIIHESGSFKFVEENLNYSSDALKKTFNIYKNNPGLADQHHRKPELIANHAYSNRMGNGGPESGDGWKFRGRGLIQLTGKNNYTDYNQHTDNNVISNPELVATDPLEACNVAGWYWDRENLNALTDEGSTIDEVIKITKRINGGTNGLEDRIKHFEIAKEVYNL